MRANFVISIAALLIAAAALVSPGAVVPAGAQEPPPNYKVAFLGDMSVNADAEAVLNLVAAEGADMVIHLGDLGYGFETNPQRAIDWDAQVTSTLGADFPYFGTVGNHDVGNWPIYQQLLEDRLALVPGASCSGDYGVMAACTYQGLFFILSGAGTIPAGPDNQPHIDYIQDQLAQDDSTWRICAWHKNQTAMQLGLKPNEVGWGPYEACRQGRAIIATGHEHSYSRTKTLSDTQTQTVDPMWTDTSVVRVAPGSTVVFVSGLAGRSIRNQDRCLPTTPPFGCNGEWASVYTADQGAKYGALFIEFHVDGNPNKASAYFKTIDGDIVDSFTIWSHSAGLGGVTEVADADAVLPAQDSAARNDATALAGVAAVGVAAMFALATMAWWWRRRTR